MQPSYRVINLIANLATYLILTVFAFVMIFPFLFMFFTSFKEPKDTFRYPPRLLPRTAVTTQVEGYDEPLPLYFVADEGQPRQFALVQDNIKIGVYADPNQPEVRSRICLTSRSMVKSCL